jgi:sporulation protein YlmC with PRC-barrel domain
VTAHSRFLWHELIGRKVFDSDGQLIDHTLDLVCRPIDGRLTVTGLLVGPYRIFARLGLHRGLRRRHHRVEVSWENIAELGDDIRLKVSRREVLAASPRLGNGGRR